MAKFQLQETAINNHDEAKTVRMGAGTGAANNWTSAEVGKLVKLAGDSRYDLCAVGDPIEGVVAAVETPTQDGYTIGSVVDCGYKYVTFDGLQATPGVGVIAVGDYVLAGTASYPKGTALGANYPKVVKATTQTGQYFAWRVVSLGTAGTGAVGTVGLIERVNC